MCVEPQAGGWGAAASLCSLFMSGLLTCDPNLQSAACKTGGVWGLLSTRYIIDIHYRHVIGILFVDIAKVHHRQATNIP